MNKFTKPVVVLGLASAVALAMAPSSCWPLFTAATSTARTVSSKRYFMVVSLLPAGRRVHGGIKAFFLLENKHALFDGRKKPPGWAALVSV